tara:strand:+ start:290 stop:505 length:216 start_codon:yes stop_codon:yes gene_type:complete
LNFIDIALEDDEEFVAQEMAKTQNMEISTPANGEWDSFPEIPEKTKKCLIEKGYASLFPIQQHCFYPVYQR